MSPGLECGLRAFRGGVEEIVLLVGAADAWGHSKFRLNSDCCRAPSS